jgi:leucine dehydrogenase
MDIETVLPSWDGELCSVRFDRETGAWFVIAVHSTRLGPASGGTRAMVYPSVGDAVADATRLAAAMTTKMAVAGLPMGGGKSVIVLPAPRATLGDDRWRRILRIHADNLQKLGGTYTTGPDIGTSSADMDILRETTPFAFGGSAATGGPGSGAPATALGVFTAVRAAVAEAGLGYGVAGLRLLVQGLGAVGGRVAELAAEAGADLLVTDLDPERCAAAAARGARVVPAAEVTRTPCDVLVPCATGGLIDARVARTLPCAVVAGAANNQLADESVADLLARQGVLWAPDFVANAGGIINISVEFEPGGYDPRLARERVRGVGDTLRSIYDAAAGGITPLAAAMELARANLSDSRA